MKSRRKINRHTSFKKIRVSYSTEIPDEFFNKYCAVHRLSRNDAASELKETAIEAAELAIDRELSEPFPNSSLWEDK